MADVGAVHNLITGHVYGTVLQVGVLNGNVLLERPTYRLQHLGPSTGTTHVPRSRRSPSYLLDARRQIVPFRERPVEMTCLCDWANDPDEPLSVLLMHGPGGAGKTRLASQFASGAAQGWTMVEAAENPVTLPPAPALSARTETQALLVIVDYADRWQLDTLTQLVTDLPQHHPDRRIRVLLLARPGSGLWKNVTSKLYRSPANLADPLPLDEFTLDRRAAFDEAVAAFAAQLEVVAQQLEPPPDLASNAYRNPLDLHMAALAAVCAHRDGEQVPGHDDLSGYLLNHERRCWSDHDSDTVEQTVFVATLFGPASDRTAARDLLSRAVLADGDAMAEELLTHHGNLYPPWSSATDRDIEILPPLRPDRLGEDFVAQCLAEQHSHARLHALLANGTHDAVSLRRALTVLAAAATRSDDARTALLAAIRNDPSLAARAPTATQCVIDRADTALAEAVYDGLPGFSTEFVQPVADLAQRLVDDLPPDVPDAVRARRLNQLGIRLSALGGDQREAAQAPTQNAVALYRRLAQDNPTAYQGDLADALNNSLLATLARPREALAAIEEAVSLNRTLVQDDAAAYLPKLAMTLGNLGGVLYLLHRPEDALAAAEEAVAIFRSRAQDDPTFCLPKLAATLDNLAVQYGPGRLREALAATEEAVTISRSLARDNPTAHLPGLGRRLQGFALVRSSGRVELPAALAAAQESITIFEDLSRGAPGSSSFAFQLRSSQELEADVLFRIGPRDEIANAFQRAGLTVGAVPLGSDQEVLVLSDAAVAWRRRLAQGNPSAYVPELAKALEAFASVRAARSVDLPAALAAAQESITTYEDLSREYPWLFADQLDSARRTEDKLRNIVAQRGSV